MEMKTLDLNKLGLTPLTEFEEQNVIGGGFWSWILGGIGAGIGFLIGGPMGAFEGALLGFACGATFDIAEGDHGQSF